MTTVIRAQQATTTSRSLMDTADQSGPRRWHEQRWLFDTSIASLGIEFDQNRLRYSLGPVRDETSGADIALLRPSVSKLSDLTPAASAHALRHERLATRLEDRGHPATAGVHWFAAAQLWLLACYPIWETTQELIDLHQRTTAAYLRWAAVADHQVEAVEVPFGGGTLPAYLHLPYHFGGTTPVPVVVASDGMDGGRESLVNRVGDEYLQNGLAVLAIDGPGQSEAAVRGVYTSLESWIEAGTAILAWIDGRAEAARWRCNASSPAHAIFEQAAPSYKARHMWMAGLERDEDAFDRLVAGYDLRGPIAGMSVPWKVFGGEADELCDKSWVYDLPDRCPGPASSLLSEGATHALDGSPAPVVGPFFRTEIADWLADRAAGVAADSVHERVTRDGRVETAR